MNSTIRNLRFSGETSKGQKISIFTVISLLIHIVFLSAALFVLKKNNHYILPSPYMVNLVSYETAPSATAGVERSPAVKPESFPGRKIENTHKPHSTMVEKKTEKPSRKEEEYITERIEAIKAKKRVEQVAALRNVISVHSGGDTKRGGSKEDVRGKGTGSFTDDYSARITREIWEQWVYPEIGKRSIEAIIIIKILKDGSVQIKGIEKSSGDSLFDRSAIRAITKASPLTPPPYEMEIGVRFYP